MPAHSSQIGLVLQNGFEVFFQKNEKHLIFFKEYY